MKAILVSCAIIFNGEKVLATKRSHSMSLSGFWEFPGGKVEAGESLQQSLVREIQEELHIKITVGLPLTPTEHSYEAGKVIRLIPFLSVWKRGEIRLLEHEEYRWLGQKELFEVNWAQADIPIVEELSRKWESLIRNM